MRADLGDHLICHLLVAVRSGERPGRERPTSPSFSENPSPLRRILGVGSTFDLRENFCREINNQAADRNTIPTQSCPPAETFLLPIRRPAHRRRLAAPRRRDVPVVQKKTTLLGLRQALPRLRPHPRPRLFDFAPLFDISVFLAYSMPHGDSPRCGVKVEDVPWTQGKGACCDAHRHFLAPWARLISWKEAAVHFGTP